MAQLGNTNIYGNLTVTGTTTSNGNFIGNLTGNASSATEDSEGQTIKSTYIKGLSVSDKVITYTKGDGTTGTITTKDTTYLAATQSANGLMSSADKKKLDSISASAEVNQNAFSNVTVGSTTIEADSKTDTLTLEAGDNITLTPDANNDKITITAKDTTYSTMKGATSSAAGAIGLVPAPAAGNQSSFLRGDGTWVVPTNTTYTFATGTTNGTISVTPSGGSATDVAVYGLGTAAYTNSSAYATSGHTHNYAGSSSVGGAATSANKLNTNAGSANTPVYFSNGIPVAIDYTISKSVPSNAEFTDTKVTQSAVKDSDYTNYRPLIFGSSNSSTKGFTPTTVTDAVYACTGLYVKPASGLIHATTFEGDLSGNASTATTATNSTKLHTVTSSTNADHFLTFVDSNNSGATSEAVYTNGSLKYNPSTNTLTATTFNGNATSATNDSNGNRITSTYLPLSGGTMTGTIMTRSNTGPALNLRNESAYMSTINYDTSGNEALAINLKNTVTSFMVNHGVDGSQWTANGKWTSVTPTLQAKNKCVYINELIPNDTSPSYNLKVNGTSYFSNKVYIGSSSSYISYNNSTGALEFNC